MPRFTREEKRLIDIACWQLLEALDIVRSDVSQEIQEMNDKDTKVLNRIREKLSKELEE